MKRKISYADTNLKSDCIVRAISKSDIIIQNEDLHLFTKFYKVTPHLHDDVILYLSKGYEYAPHEIVAFYPNGKMWAGYGNNFKEVIKGAFEDARWYM